MDKTLMTPQEYADYSGLSIVVVYRVCKQSDCPAASQIGRRWIIHCDRMTDWLLTQRSVGMGATHKAR